MSNIKREIELEITSACNARCPHCFRTKAFGNYNVEHISLEDIKRIFPESYSMDDWYILLCGVLGDPVTNPDCYDIVKYFIDKNGFCELNTNGGLGTAKWWHELGTLSKESNRVSVWFCVDGHSETNHYYRVGTDFKIIERNMQIYADAGGKGTWVYTLFDHNKEELEIAKEHAKRLNFKFMERMGTSNHIPTEVITRKSHKDKATETAIITAAEDIKHPGADLATQLRDKYQPKKLSQYRKGTQNG